jgi:hypothetical protein
VEAPEWWYLITAIFAVLGSLALIGLIVAVAVLIKKMKDLQPKVEAISDRIDRIGERVERISETVEGNPCCCACAAPMLRNATRRKAAIVRRGKKSFIGSASPQPHPHARNACFPPYNRTA